MNTTKTAQVGEPPRRGSFQEDVSFRVDRPMHSAPKHWDDDEAGQTIEVVNTDAVKMNAGQVHPPQLIDLEDDSMLTDDDRGFTKSSSGSRRHSTTASISSMKHSLTQPSQSSETAAADTSKNAYQLPTDPNMTTGKLRNRYVTSDGTVVNGKGLGRGRPGFKRGPRRSILSNEVTGTPEGDPTKLFTPSPASKTPSLPTKRKRTDSYQSEIKDEDDDLSSLSSRDSTPEYNPATSTQTRSGRQSQKPVAIVVPSSSTKAPAKRPSLPQSMSSPSIKKHPKIKAKVYRGREQFALCEHCLRGNGPPGNVIVFCDACNKCWHQRCHSPKISKEVVADTTAEWFCSDCDRILHGKKKAKPFPKAESQSANNQPVPLPTQIAPAPVISTVPSLNTNPQPRYGLPYIPGMALTPIQRKAYLTSLSKERLIEIVLRAADLAPNMPIFETPLYEIPQPPQFPPHNNSSSPFPFPTLPKSMRPPLPPGFPPQQHQTQPQYAQPSQQSQLLPRQPTAPPPSITTSIPTYSHPTAGIPSKPNTNPITHITEEDEGYYDDYDELALIYPKPGEGVYDLALPVESSDLGILLEGPESRTFSHWVRGRGEVKGIVG